MAKDRMVESAAAPRARCYVRVLERRDDDFVVFEFAIGDPELSVELILRSSQFVQFCDRHQAVMVDAALGEQLDAARTRWRYGQPGVHH